MKDIHILTAAVRTVYACKVRFMENGFKSAVVYRNTLAFLKTHQHDNGYGAYWPPSGHGVELKDETPSSSQCGTSGIRTRAGKPRHGLPAECAYHYTTERPLAELKRS